MPYCFKQGMEYRGKCWQKVVNRRACTSRSLTRALLCPSTPEARKVPLSRGSCHQPCAKHWQTGGARLSGRFVYSYVGPRRSQRLCHHSTLRLTRLSSTSYTQYKRVHYCDAILLLIVDRLCCVHLGPVISSHSSPQNTRIHPASTIPIG